MPLVSQQGEVADRLRRFFRITGRIPSGVDETVVPVANLQSLDSPPWRLAPRNFGAFVETAAAVALNSYAGIHMLFGTPGACVIRDIWIRNSAAAFENFSIFLVADAETVATYALGAQVPNTEDINPGPAGAVQALLPPARATFTVAPLPFGIEIWRGLVSLGSLLHVQLRREVVLRGTGFGAGQVSQGLFVACRTVNVTVGASFAGTYYPDA